jgi:hypothetical protein
MNLVAFAPDWLVANAKLAADVYTGIKRLPPGVPIPFEAMRSSGEVGAFYARQYAFRQRMILATMMNFMNYAFTLARTGKGRFMDENPPGFRNKVAMPFANEQGREDYYIWGKVFTEPHDMIAAWQAGDGPLRFLRRKLSPMAGAAITAISGYQLNGEPIVTTKDGPAATIMKQMVQPFAEPFEPFSVRMLRQSMFPGVTPITKTPRPKDPWAGIAAMLGLGTVKGPAKGSAR